MNRPASFAARLRAFAAAPVFHVLLALCAVHCLNDLLQSVISAVYPMLKSDMGLSFAQIGIITLVYQIAASVFQPVVGLVFDRHPSVWSLPAGMCSTTVGIVLFSFADSYPILLLAVTLVGIGSSTLHPEASRITSLAGEGRRGLAQSVFQVGGNLGSSLGPLLVALAVAPYGRRNVLWFLIASAAAFAVLRPVVRWYSGHLRHTGGRSVRGDGHLPYPFSPQRTAAVILVLVVLIFSKYIYMASITNYLTFYMIRRFGITIQMSQLCLFVFLVSTAVGTMVGGPVGDRIGRKPVIWISILGAAPFTLLLPHVGLAMTVVMSFMAGFMLSSAFPAILLYSQELLPNKLGLVSGLFFGFAFGVAGVASALLGVFADRYGIEAVYNSCAYMPLLGIVAALLPDLRSRR